MRRSFKMMHIHDGMTQASSRMQVKGVDTMTNLTGITVNGTAITPIASSMSIELPSTANLASIPVVLTAAEGCTVTFRGTAVTSGTSFNANFSEASSAAIVVTSSAEPPVVEEYTVTVTQGSWDDVFESGMVTIARMGWFAAREFNGDLDTYTPGGIAVPLGSFRPKHVINVMVTGGFTGEWDVVDKKLKVYKAGTEATQAQLKSANAKFTMILME